MTKQELDILEGLEAFTPSERRILAEIARHRVSPGLMSQALRVAGKPLEKAMRLIALSPLKSISRLQDLVQSGIRKGLEASFDAAVRWAPERRVLERARVGGIEADRPEDLARIPLDRRDHLADSFDRGATVILGAEGAALGAATTLATGVPFAQLLIPGLIATDVAASMTLLSRHAATVAACYGRSPQDPETRIHIVAAMAPAGDSPDEGYLTVKTAAVETIREAGAFVAKQGVRSLQQALIEKEAPQLIRLMNYVAQRLGIVLTEKQLGMLVPIAGAALNGGLNVAFHKVGHEAAKDYFRILALEECYGEGRVRSALEALMALERQRAAHPKV